MTGSDGVGKFDGLGNYLPAFEPFIEALPEQVAQSFARDNFLAVLPHKPR